jgi:hypothetical protein
VIPPVVGAVARRCAAGRGQVTGPGGAVPEARGESDVLDGVEVPDASTGGAGTGVSTGTASPGTASTGGTAVGAGGLVPAPRAAEL